MTGEEKSDFPAGQYVCVWMQHSALRIPAFCPNFGAVLRRSSHGDDRAGRDLDTNV